MKEGLKLYLDWFKYAIPDFVYEGVLSVLCIGAVSLLIWKGWNSWRLIARLVFLEYVFLLYCSTVFFRVPKSEDEYNFIPFWSYYAIQSGREDLWAENLLNVIVFVPIGILLGCSSPLRRLWNVILVGSSISVSIEFLQMAFKRGFSEVDDVMHNTLGCMIGYGIYSLARVGYERITKRNLGVL